MSKTTNQVINKLNNGNLEDLFSEIEGRPKVKQPVNWQTKAEKSGNKDYWVDRILGTQGYVE